MVVLVCRVRVLLLFLLLFSGFSTAKDRRNSLNHKEDLDHYSFQKTKTSALIIQKQGRVIYERYGAYWGPNDPHLLWSMTKSLFNVLTGVAVKEGRIILDESICANTELVSDFCRIHVRDVLNFSSGLEWNESYEESVRKSSPASMLYSYPALNMSEFILGLHPIATTPGTRWRYSSGDSHVLSRVLQEAYSREEYNRLPWRTFARKAGINTLSIEQDMNGTFVASSYAYMSPRDVLKWGNFVLDEYKTKSQGDSILPLNWMQDSLEAPTSFFDNPILKNPRKIGAAHWWINKAYPSEGVKKAWDFLPEDAFLARGHWGQLLVVVPSMDLVIVRLGDDRKKKHYSHTELLKNVMEFVTAQAINEVGEGNEALLSDQPAQVEYFRRLKFSRQAKIYAAGRAKMYCSCLYVSKKDADYCNDYSKMGTAPHILFKVKNDPLQKIVQVGRKKAQFKGQGLGCSLLN